MINETKNRFDRIVAILTQLQSTRLLKARDLAERFGVSLRTIYRDIRSLETAGVPVSGEAGMGYSLMDGYRLPPVMFSREEASGFVAAEKLMQKFMDKQSYDHYASAMFKIRSVLRGNLKEHMDQLGDQIWMDPVNELFKESTPDALAVLLESVAARKQVSLLYQTYESEEPSQRDIESVGLFHEGNNWHVMGFCHLRNDYRQFRIDRIRQIRLLDKPFTRAHESIEWFRRQRRPDASINVVIRVEKDVMKYLGSGKNYYGIDREELIGDEVELSFKVSEVEGLARWYMMFGDHARIISPETFREKVLEICGKIAR